MKTHKFFLALMAAALVVSCGEGNTTEENASQNESQPNGDHGDMHEHMDGHDHGQADGNTAEVSTDETPVSLNNGKPWQANAETTAGIKNMKGLLDDFNPNADDAAYAALYEDLDREFKTIFEKCTMEGEAHNQLHNYLYPMRAMLDDLRSEDPAIRRAAKEKLQTRLADYPKYFV